MCVRVSSGVVLALYIYIYREREREAGRPARMIAHLCSLVCVCACVYTYIRVYAYVCVCVNPYSQKTKKFF